MGSYIAVTLKQPRTYKFWLGRKCLDGSIALIAEFVNEHTLGVVVLKLNDEPISELRMDKEQPDKVNFNVGYEPRTKDGAPLQMRPHPDSVRAHNVRWPNDQRNPENGRAVRKPDRDGQPAGVPADAAGDAGAGEKDAYADHGAAPDSP